VNGCLCLWRIKFKQMGFTLQLPVERHETRLAEPHPSDLHAGTGTHSELRVIHIFQLHRPARPASSIRSHEVVVSLDASSFRIPTVLHPCPQSKHVKVIARKR